MCSDCAVGLVWLAARFRFPLPPPPLKDITGSLIKSAKKIPIDLNTLCGQTIREHIILHSRVTDTDNCIDVCIQIKE